MNNYVYSDDYCALTAGEGGFTLSYSNVIKPKSKLTEFNLIPEKTSTNNSHPLRSEKAGRGRVDISRIRRNYWE